MMIKFKRPSFQMKLLGLFLGVITLFAIIYAAYYGISKRMIQKNMISYSEIYVDSITGSITGGPNAPYSEGVSLVSESWYHDFMQSGFRKFVIPWNCLI